MDFLQKYVTEELKWKPEKLKQAYLSLQAGYRSRQKIGYSNTEQIQSYVFTRFPATYSVCLKILKQYLSEISINSVLDWGCGVGTASLALSEMFENLDYILVEQDELAKNYAKQFLNHFFPNNKILPAMPDKFDLSIFSYSLGEVSSWKKILDDIFPKTEYLLIIEPGTPSHFQGLLEMRKYLLLKGAYIWGPCCHSAECPIQQGDWCHFSLNVSRDKNHKLLKNAVRGFEQESYCYLFFSKTPKKCPTGRIIADPRIHSGHIDLKICHEDGDIKKQVIARSSQDYMYIKKAKWGDSI